VSLTQTENVFASIHESALNDVLTAFCTERPRYLVYGSPSFVPATTVAETAMPAIAFPGVPGGIQWRVRLSIPRVDLFPKTFALPPQLSLSQGRFSAEIAVELCLDCRLLRIDPRPPKPRHGKDEPSRDPKRPPTGQLTCCQLEVFAVGHIQHVLAATGEDAIALAVDGVEIVDISPDEVEAVLECLLFMILQAVLAEIRLPLRALRAGAFQLSLTVGPLIEDDQVKVRGGF
jgi:hypothetical protein